eukprot:5194891-Lingulodinium_polyedra.AAC.1
METPRSVTIVPGPRQRSFLRPKSKARPFSGSAGSGRRDSSARTPTSSRGDRPSTPRRAVVVRSDITKGEKSDKGGGVATRVALTLTPLRKGAVETHPDFE